MMNSSVRARSQREQRPNVRWGAGEHLAWAAEHFGLLDLEHRAGRAHGGAGVLESHRHKDDMVPGTAVVRSELHSQVGPRGPPPRALAAVQ